MCRPAHVSFIRHHGAQTYAHASGLADFPRLTSPDARPTSRKGCLIMPRTYTSAQGLHARAGRVAENPLDMTQAANVDRLGKHIAAALKANPELTPQQAAKAGRLLLKDEMAQLAEKSKTARAQRAAGPAQSVPA
jgi:hypothetical protein